MKKSTNCNLYVQLTKNLKLLVPELLYFLSFSIYLINAMLNTTMFNVYLSNGIKKVCLLVSIFLILFKILIFDRYSIKNIIYIGILFIIMLVAGILSGYKNLLLLALLIVGAKDVSFKRIIKIYLTITISITIIAMIAVKFGVIEHIIYYRNGKARYSFGSIYCTDFAAHIFYIIVSYCYVKGMKIGMHNIVIFIICGMFVYKYAGARLDAISIFVVCIYYIYILFKQRFRKNSGKIKLNWFMKFVMVFSVPVSAFISIFITNIYSSANYNLVKLNSILSNRLSYGKRGIDEYGFKLFGQQVAMNGNGGTNRIIENYFFIDSSYLYIALRYGIMILMLFCIYFIFLNKRMIKENNFIIPIIVMFIAINSIVAHHFTDVAYNPFILCLFAKIDDYNF